MLQYVTFKCVFTSVLQSVNLHCFNQFQAAYYKWATIENHLQGFKVVMPSWLQSELLAERPAIVRFMPSNNFTWLHMFA